MERTTLEQEYPLGTRMETEDGRVFRYTRAMDDNATPEYFWGQTWGVATVPIAEEDEPIQEWEYELELRASEWTMDMED